MNPNSRITKRTLASVALIVSLVLAPSMTTQAATNGGTLRVMTQGETHTGCCCTVWSDSLEVVQPEKPLPMVVTWSTDYRSTGPMEVGLRLNNGPCTFYGPAFLTPAAPANDAYASTTLHWVILPGDYGLVKGTGCDSAAEE